MANNEVSCYGCNHYKSLRLISSFFFFQAEDGIRDLTVTGVQTCALPICGLRLWAAHWTWFQAPARELRLLRRSRLARSSSAEQAKHEQQDQGENPAITDRKSVV